MRPGPSVGYAQRWILHTCCSSSAVVDMIWNPGFP